MADGLHHTTLLPSLTKGMALTAKPCQREAAAKRQSHAAEGWQVGRVQMQHRWHRHLLCRLLQHADAGALRDVVFLLQTRPVREKRSRRAVGSGAAHAHRTARPTHTLHIVPKTSRPRRRWAKSCGGGLAGCRCNIDDTAVCFVDCYCSMLTRVLCSPFFFAADATGQRKQYISSKCQFCSKPAN